MSRLSNQKQIKSVQQLKHIYHSQKLESKNKEISKLTFTSKNTPCKLQSSIKNNDSEIKNILSDLRISSQLIYFQKFQKKTQQIFDKLIEKILVLEYKIAECQKKFNFISLELRRKSCEIVGIKKENKKLIQLNNQVEVNLKDLKYQYEKSLNQQEYQGTRKKIKELKQSIQKIHKDNDVENKLLFSIKDLLQQLKTHFKQENQKNILEVVSKIVYLSFKNVQIDQTLSQYVQSKILENIDLKVNKLISI